MTWLKLIILVTTGIYIMYWDFKEHRIPNKVNILILLSGIGVTFIEYNLWLDHLLGFLVLGSFMLLLTVLTNGFGLGDIKYIYSFALLLGLKQGLSALVIGILIGGLVSGVLLLLKKVNKKDHIAYGPYLVLGTWLSFLL